MTGIKGLGSLAGCKEAASLTHIQSAGYTHTHITVRPEWASCSIGEAEEPEVAGPASAD